MLQVKTFSNVFVLLVVLVRIVIFFARCNRANVGCTRGSANNRGRGAHWNAMWNGRLQAGSLITLLQVDGATKSEYKVAFPTYWA